MVQGLFRLIPLAVLCLWLAGCASRPQGPAPALDIPAEDPVRDTPALALLQEAAAARQRGDTSAAGRHLERALSLAPGSSWVYRQLAELRLQQGEARAAEGFIRRALRHATSGDPFYRASLYELLAVSLARQGNVEAAQAAREQAAAIRARAR